MNKKGFTLIELMVVIVILGILASFIFSGIQNFDFRSDDIKPYAEESMRSYVKTLYPELMQVNVKCSNIDSDYNGYVRCTATGLNSKEKRETIIAECDDSDNCVPIQNVDR